MYIVLVYNDVFMNNAVIVLGLAKKRRFCKLLLAYGDIQKIIILNELLVLYIGNMRAILF